MLGLKELILLVGYFLNAQLNILKYEHQETYSQETYSQSLGVASCVYKELGGFPFLSPSTDTASCFETALLT